MKRLMQQLKETLFYRREKASALEMSKLPVKQQRITMEILQLKHPEKYGVIMMFLNRLRVEAAATRRRALADQQLQVVRALAAGESKVTLTPVGTQRISTPKLQQASAVNRSRPILRCDLASAAEQAVWEDAVDVYSGVEDTL